MFTKNERKLAQSILKRLPPSRVEKPELAKDEGQYWERRAERLKERQKQMETDFCIRSLAKQGAKIIASKSHCHA